MYLYSRQTPGAMGMALLANSKAEGRHVLPYLGPGIAVIESYDGAVHLTHWADDRFAEPSLRQRRAGCGLRRGEGLHGSMSVAVFIGR